MDRKSITRKRLLGGILYVVVDPRAYRQQLRH
jgi:hypothetical protein